MAGLAEARGPAAGPRANHRILAALRQFRHSPGGSLIIRIAIGVIGTAVIATGIVLLPLPGPGWLIIFAGLGILSLEFAWAERLLRFARIHVLRWEKWYLRQGIGLRLLVGAGLAVLVGGILLLTARYTLGWPTIVRWWHLLPGA